MSSPRMRAPTVKPATALVALALLSAGVPAVAAPAARPPIPVILDTDIGDDIDDSWALVLALRSPELDVKLVVTDFGKAEYRAKIVARLLEIAGRSDIPIGMGVDEVDEKDGDAPQAEWVEDYDLARYPGRILKDGVQALIDTAMGSREPVTLVAIGPPPNLRAALEREPKLASRLRLAGMYGSLRLGYGGKPVPAPEWNVQASVPAARALLAAPWAQAIATPLDTCGLVQLKGERYARVRDSRDPLVRALIDNYRLWCGRRDWCARDEEFVRSKSSTLFDTVAVYLAISRDLVKTEELGVRVTDEGLTLPDPVARPLTWATEWRDLGAFEEWLTARLAAPPAAR